MDPKRNGPDPQILREAPLQSNSATPFC